MQFETDISVVFQISLDLLNFTKSYKTVNLLIRAFQKEYTVFFSTKHEISLPLIIELLQYDLEFDLHLTAPIHMLFRLHYDRSAYSI